MSIAVMDEAANLLGFARYRRRQAPQHQHRDGQGPRRRVEPEADGQDRHDGEPLDDHMAIALPLAAGPRCT